MRTIRVFGRIARNTSGQKYFNVRRYVLNCDRCAAAWFCGSSAASALFSEVSKCVKLCILI